MQYTTQSIWLVACLVQASLGSTIGGYAQSILVTSRKKDDNSNTQSNLKFPTDEWFREKIDRVTSRIAENFFDVSVLNQMNHTKMFKAFMKKGIVIALDIHDRSRYDKNYGDELARGRYLDGDVCMKDISLYNV